MTAVAASSEGISAPDARNEHDAPVRHTPSAFETEQVREFTQSPPPSPAAPAYTGPGYAPAAPVKIEWPADLQQVESDPDKVKAVEQEAAPELSAPRPKRVRQSPPPVSNEPLVQIETERPEASGPGQEEKAPV